MSETTSKTPRTDEVVRSLIAKEHQLPIEIVLTDFARQLETELNEAKEERDKLAKEKHDELIPIANAVRNYLDTYGNTNFERVKNAANRLTEMERVAGDAYQQKLKALLAQFCSPPYTHGGVNIVVSADDLKALLVEHEQLLADKARLAETNFLIDRIKSVVSAHRECKCYWCLSLAEYEKRTAISIAAEMEKDKL